MPNKTSGAFISNLAPVYPTFIYKVLSSLTLLSWLIVALPSRYGKYWSTKEGLLEVCPKSVQLYCPGAFLRKQARTRRPEKKFAINIWTLYATVILCQVFFSLSIITKQHFVLACQIDVVNNFRLLGAGPYINAADPEQMPGFIRGRRVIVSGI